MVGDDFRSRVERIERERRAELNAAEQAKLQSIAALNRMCSRIIALRQQSRELQTTAPPKIVVPPFAPYHDFGLDFSSNWIPNSESNTNPPYIRLEHIGNVSYNPLTRKWYHPGVSRDGVSEEDLFDYCANNMASWAIDVFPREEGQRIAKENAEAAQAEERRIQSQQTFIGCGALVVAEIVAFSLFFPHPFIAVAIGVVSPIIFHHWSESR
ncbi:MAG: hypothetical protein QOH86_2077 [Sphingomonadales bacterium]|nr:hypothetical protein [Sphingomonadales bacterium]